MAYRDPVAPGTTGTETLVSDAQIAARLRMPLKDVRALIRRNRDDGHIQPIANVRTVRRFTKDGKHRGSIEVEEFLLTQDDALFLVTRSGAAEAVRLTKVMIAVFRLALRGLLILAGAVSTEEAQALREEVAPLRADLVAARAEARALAAGPLIGTRLARTSILNLLVRVAQARVGRIAGDAVTDERRDLDDDLRDYLGFDARSAWGELPSEDLGRALSWLLRKLHRAENRAARKGRATQGSLPFDGLKPKRTRAKKTDAPN